MKIWVDADACPAMVKEILYKACKRTNTPLILVANSYLVIPPSPLYKFVQVGHGFDVADNYIVQEVSANELVITADIPLAAEVVARLAIALNPRGELYTENNIKQRLGMRDIREQMRSTGVQLGGPSAYGPKEKMAFANAIDRILAKSKGY